MWNQDGYIKAWNFASRMHHGQVVPGTEMPYINHLGLVAMESMAAVASGAELDSPDLLVLCALLHDVIEDTNGTYHDIHTEFGIDAANGVLALSKDKKLPSKEDQMKDSIERIRREPKEIWMVKMSDRITNLQPPPTNWSKERIDEYRTEATFILSELGDANTSLAARLGAKIRDYS